MILTEASDRSLFVSFGGIESHSRALNLFRSLREDPIGGVVNLHPSYGSLLIEFDPLHLCYPDLADAVSRRSSHASEVQESKFVTVPVSYGGEWGPDLAEVARLHNISEARAIELHASVDYTVYFFGFVPGFAYLGILPEQLATPRLSSPRTHVPPGSVGIADRQTGIYPMSTPGGWRLLGRTRLPITVGLLEPGDKVRFQPVSE